MSDNSILMDTFYVVIYIYNRVKINRLIIKLYLLFDKIRINIFFKYYEIYDSHNQGISR